MARLLLEPAAVMMRLATAVIGTGRPRFAFLHGLLGRGRNWTQIAQGVVSDHDSALLIDLPNHGDSPWTTQFSYHQMAQAVIEELHARDVEQLVLVGHSMGGKVAMLAALTEPTLFAGLAVVDISPTDSAQVSSLGPYLEAMLGIDLTTLASKADAEAHLARAVPSPAVRQFLLTNLRDRGGWQWQPNLVLLHDALTELAGWPSVPAATYPGPCSWIVGERSVYYRREDLNSMRSLFPQAQEVVIPGAGHWVHADNPTAVIAALNALSAASPR